MKGMWQSKRSLKRQRDYLSARCATAEANLARLVELAERAVHAVSYEQCSAVHNLRLVLREIKEKRDA